MTDSRESPSRLELIRQIAEKRRKSGEHERSLKKLRSLSFIVNPRMPKSATLREPDDKEDLVSDVGGQAREQRGDDVDEFINQYVPKNPPRTSPTQKLYALWGARKALGLKSGQEVRLEKLVVLAANELGLLPVTIRNFINQDMTAEQRISLKKGLRLGDKAY